MDIKITNRIGSDAPAGSISLGALPFPEGKICVTDPCYAKDVWCRIDDLSVVPGNYTGRIMQIADDPSHPDWTVVSKLVIGLTDEICSAPETSWKRVSEIGVDAGLAGIWSKKPDFKNDEWSIFCQALGCSDCAWVFDSDDLRGFCSSSGYGDGGYEVFGHPSAEDPAVYDGIKILFLCDDD